MLPDIRRFRSTSVKNLSSSKSNRSGSNKPLALLKIRSQKKYSRLTQLIPKIEQRIFDWIDKDEDYKFAELVLDLQ